MSHLPNIISRLIFLILISYMINGCINQEDCPRYAKISANLFPKKMDFHIGDTITISSKFHKEVLVFNSEQKEIGTLDLSAINWMPSTSIFRIDTIGQGGVTTIHKYFFFIDDARYDYNLFIESENFSALDGDYNFRNDSFDLEIRIITKRPGTFFLTQEAGTGFQSEQKFPNKCPGINIESWVNMNNGEDNNVQLLQSSPDSFWSSQILNNPQENFFNNGGYCFRVLP